MGTFQGRPLTELLEISGLRVRYGAFAALGGIDLTIRQGEMFVLLGASGSGKTTLLRAIAGFAQPDAGRIVLDGADITGLPPHRRPVNTMFQSYALFPHLSVAANVAFGLRGVERAAIASRVAEMLTLVRLENFGARRPHQLSGGQQQRVALARSLAPNPRLLLLDEPLSALDRNLRAETRAELVALQKRIGTSFILVTHDQEEALVMADRIGVMHAGRLLQVGAPAEVYERPNSRYVAEFLGAANILQHANGGLYAVRPERMRLGEEGGHMRAQGVVCERAYAGETITYGVRLPDGAVVRVTDTVRDGIAAATPNIGAAVIVSWPAAACIPLPR